LTHYLPNKYVLTNDGIKVYNEYEEVDLSLVDIKVRELETCLNIKIKRCCFALLIPNDWFLSECSGEQMLPVAAPYSQCESKGIYVPENCRGLNKPTQECPCICTYRVALQEDYYIITPPNLKLFKSELARLVTNINNPWEDKNISKCLL
jgi:hypothetical protein